MHDVTSHVDFYATLPQCAASLCNDEIAAHPQIKISGA